MTNLDNEKSELVSKINELEQQMASTEKILLNDINLDEPLYIIDTISLIFDSLTSEYNVNFYFKLKKIHIQEEPVQTKVFKKANSFLIKTSSQNFVL